VAAFNYVGTPRAGADGDDPVRGVVEDVLRTGIVLSDLIAGLIDDLPEDAFPGEDAAEVVVEMLIGSARPALEAAGAAALSQASALLGALFDRTIADLRVAAEIAAARSE
jgi:hypothetical protein